MKFSKHFIIFFLMLFPFTFFGTNENLFLAAAYAQKKGIKIQGEVKDKTGEPLIGVNIIVEGATTGTITDFDGKFILEVPALGALLKVSYVGYKPKEIVIRKNEFNSIVLEENSQSLDEVTVVAYGVQKKATLTGSISQIGSDELLKSPSASVTNALSGAITGVSSVQSSGQPGKDDAKIFIRGVGSLTEGASSPLVLVDGVERSFSQLDPNEIENISVLKDASATAVFGVRGANGVILVTTKRGKEGQTRIGVSSSFGVQVPIKLIDFVDSYTWAMGGNEIYANDGKPESAYIFKPWVLDALKHNKYPEVLPNTDWREYCFKDASFQTQHNITISGGSKSVKYFTSIGYLYQDGMFKNLGTDYNSNFNYNRYNYRTNFDIDVTKTTSMKLNIGGRLEKRNEPNASTDGQLWSRINWSSPLAGAGVVNGVRGATANEYIGGIVLRDPLESYFDRGFNNTSRNVLNLDYVISQKLDVITKGLSAEVKASYNANFQHGKRRVKEPKFITPKFKSTVDPTAVGDSSTVYVGSGTANELSYSEATSKSRDWYLEASLRYARDFKQHRVSGLLLYNQSKSYYPGGMYNSIPRAYVGLVGRLTYDYASKYLVEVNAGYNGSENFAPGKTRYGLFPSLSAGWVVSEEDFMKKQSLINFLKLRASVGVVGNDILRINGVAQRFLYQEDKYTVDQIGNNWGYNFGVNIPQKIPGASEGMMGNPIVTWEKALKQNYGADITLLDQRLSLNADLFFEKRWDILTTRTTTPVFVAAQLPAMNIGKVDNKGWEAAVKWEESRGKIRYWVSGNVSFSRNKIIYMDETPPNEDYLWRTGRPVGVPFGRKFYTFYKEGLTYPDGSPLADHTITLKPGDAVYFDLNEDGKIDNDDECQIGFPDRPEYSFGFRYGISYKGFDVSMQWSGATNVSRVLSDVYRTPYGGQDTWRTLFQYMWDERWTPDNAENAKSPRFSYESATNNYANSSLWLRDASYIRLKTIEVGYTFSSAGLKRTGINSLRLYANGYNLLTFDKLKIVDPEEPTSGGDYPLAKIFNLGISVQF